MTINGSEKLACRTSLRQRTRTTWAHRGCTAPQLAGDQGPGCGYDVVLGQDPRRASVAGVGGSILLRCHRHEATPTRSFTMSMPASCAALASRLVPCMKSRRGLSVLPRWRRLIGSSPTRENLPRRPVPGSRRSKTNMESGTAHAAISVWRCARKMSNRWRRLSGCGGPRSNEG